MSRDVRPTWSGVGAGQRTRPGRHPRRPRRTHRVLVEATPHGGTHDPPQSPRRHCRPRFGRRRRPPHRPRPLRRYDPRPPRQPRPGHHRTTRRTHRPRSADADGQEVLAGVLQRDTAERSATETLRSLLEPPSYQRLAAQLEHVVNTINRNAGPAASAQQAWLDDHQDLLDLHDIIRTLSTATRAEARNTTGNRRNQPTPTSPSLTSAWSSESESTSYRSSGTVILGPDHVPVLLAVGFIDYCR